MASAPNNRLQGLHLSNRILGKVRRRRSLAFLAMATFGVALSWVGFRYSENEARRANNVRFEQQASRIAADMETAFNSSLEHLHSIPAFFAASDNVTREDFHRFVTPVLQRNEIIYISAFLPRVLAEERINFEAKARAEGLKDFTIHAVDADGKTIPHYVAWKRIQTIDLKVQRNSYQNLHRAPLKHGLRKKRRNAGQSIVRAMILPTPMRPSSQRY